MPMGTVNTSSAPPLSSTFFAPTICESGESESVAPSPTLMPALSFTPLPIVNEPSRTTVVSFPASSLTVSENAENRISSATSSSSSPADSPSFASSAAT